MMSMDPTIPLGQLMKYSRQALAQQGSCVFQPNKVLSFFPVGDISQKWDTLRCSYLLSAQDLSSTRLPKLPVDATE